MPAVGQRVAEQPVAVAVSAAAVGQVAARLTPQAFEAQLELAAAEELVACRTVLPLRVRRRLLRMLTG